MFMTCASSWHAHACWQQVYVHDMRMLACNTCMFMTCASSWHAHAYNNPKTNERLRIKIKNSSILKKLMMRVKKCDPKQIWWRESSIARLCPLLRSRHSHLRTGLICQNYNFSSRSQITRTSDLDWNRKMWSGFYFQKPIGWSRISYLLLLESGTNSVWEELGLFFLFIYKIFVCFYFSRKEHMHGVSSSH